MLSATMISVRHRTVRNFQKAAMYSTFCETKVAATVLQPQAPKGCRQNVSKLYASGASPAATPALSGSSSVRVMDPNMCHGSPQQCLRVLAHGQVWVVVINSGGNTSLGKYVST